MVKVNESACRSFLLNLNSEFLNSSKKCQEQKVILLGDPEQKLRFENCVKSKPLSKKHKCKIVPSHNEIVATYVQ